MPLSNAPAALTALTLTFATLATAAAAEILEYPYRPGPGDAWTVAGEREVQQTGAGRSGATSAATTGRLFFVRRLDDAYLMEWRGAVAEGAPPPPSVRFRADARGTPLALEEPEVVLEAFVPGGEATADRRAALLTLPPSSLARLILPEVALAASCQGLRLDPDAAMTDRLEAQSILGSPPVERTATAILLKRGGKRRPMRARIIESDDPASLEAALRTLAEAQGLPPGAPLPELNRTTITTCEVNRQTGVAQSVERTSEVASGDNRQVEIRRVTLTPRSGG